MAPITVGRKGRKKKTQGDTFPNLMKTQGDRNQRKVGAWTDVKIKLEPRPPTSLDAPKHIALEKLLEKQSGVAEMGGWWC